MGLLDLIEQHHGVGLPSHRLGELSAFLIAHISGRRSDQSGNGVFLHVFAHVDPHHVLLIVEQGSCKRLRQLRFSHAGRPEEHEGADGFGGILDSGLGADNGLRHLFHALVLSDHPLMKLLIQVQGLAAFALGQLCHGDSGPAGDDPCDLILADTLMDQRKVFVLHLFLFRFQLLFQVRKLSVAQLGGLFQIAFPLCDLDLAVHRVDLFPQFGKLIHAGLFVVPLGLAVLELLLLLRQLLLQVCKPLLAQPVLFLLQRRFLDLQLHDLSLQLVQLCGHGIHLGLDQGAGFVHQVDGLVRQEPVGNVSVGKHGRAHQRVVHDFHAVIYLVALL